MMYQIRLLKTNRFQSIKAGNANNFLNTFILQFGSLIKSIQSLILFIVVIIIIYKLYDFKMFFFPFG